MATLGVMFAVGWRAQVRVQQMATPMYGYEFSLQEEAENTLQVRRRTAARRGTQRGEEGIYRSEGRRKRAPACQCSGEVLEEEEEVVG